MKLYQASNDMQSEAVNAFIPECKRALLTCVTVALGPRAAPRNEGQEIFYSSAYAICFSSYSHRGGAP